MVSLVLQEAFQTFLLFYSCTFLHFCIFLHYPPPSPSPPSCAAFRSANDGPQDQAVYLRSTQGGRRGWRDLVVWGSLREPKGVQSPPLQGSKQGEGLG